MVDTNLRASESKERLEDDSIHMNNSMHNTSQSRIIYQNSMSRSNHQALT